MTAELCFVDSNVLVYAFDNDTPDKRDKARELLEKRVDSIVISTQVLGEFYVTMTRKLAKKLPPADAASAVEAFSTFQVQPLTAWLVKEAVHRSIASKVSYWDALIIETAIDAGATSLLTEDLHDAQVFGELKLENPFL